MARFTLSSIAIMALAAAASAQNATVTDIVSLTTTVPCTTYTSDGSVITSYTSTVLPGTVVPTIVPYDTDLPSTIVPYNTFVSTPIAPIPTPVDTTTPLGTAVASGSGGLGPAYNGTVPQASTLVPSGSDASSTATPIASTNGAGGVKVAGFAVSLVGGIAAVFALL